MPTRKQKIFATFRYIKERHPSFFHNYGAKVCFRISKTLVDEFEISNGDRRDRERIVKYLYNYIVEEAFKNGTYQIF